jgi:Tfp pilus assembly protein PilX
MVMNRIRKGFIDERGIALPVALAVLFVTAGLATVAARSAITASHQSFRDENAKRAIQAAVSGIQNAVYQTNLTQPNATQCATRNGSGQLATQAVQSNGWCTAMTEVLGDGATYSEQVSQATAVTVNSITVQQRQIASTGTVNGVTRRVLYTVQAATGAQIFPTGYAMLADQSISMKNNADVQGGLASNGNITLKNNANVCGPITAGPGKTYSHGANTTVCTGYSTTNATQPFAIQPVDLNNAIPNDNDRITRAVTNSCSGSGCVKDSCGTTSACSKISWNPTTKALIVNNGGTLTLSGDKYFFCRLEIKGGGVVQIASRTTPMAVYIDKPENCSGVSGGGSVAWNSSGNFVNLSSNPATFVLYVAGSTNVATSVDLSSNDQTGNGPIIMAIYAPNSTVTYANNLNFTGAIVAKSIDLKNNAQITYDSRVTGITTGSSIRFYKGYDYKECAGAPTGTTPETGC